MLYKLTLPYSRQEVYRNLQVKIDELSKRISYNRNLMHLKNSLSEKRDLELKIEFDTNTLIVNELLFKKLFSQ